MRKIISIILVVVWMLVIFYLSNQNKVETNETTDIIYKLFHIKSDSLILFTLIRKSAHLIEYFILGILVYNMLKNFNISNILVCSIFICIIYSCTDEIHQLFIYERSFGITDILIDMMGSMIAYLFVKIILHKK